MDPQVIASLGCCDPLTIAGMGYTEPQGGGGRKKRRFRIYEYEKAQSINDDELIALVLALYR